MKIKLGKSPLNPWRICRLRARGFTLIELLISVAMVLILMVGINQVFSISTRTIQAGNTMAEESRNSRGALSVMSDDFRNVVRDAPMFIIYSTSSLRSSSGWGFQNKADQISDADQDPKTWDLTKSGAAETSVSVMAPSFRNHRTDMVMFPVRGLYRRQTGNFGTFMADMSSTEAWVWYGHLNYVKPTDSQDYTDNTNGGEESPGSNNNGSDVFYATDQILGRVALLMKPGAAGPMGAAPPKDDNSSAQVSYRINGAPPSFPEFKPLGKDNVSDASVGVANSSPMTIPSSRYDLLDTTIDTLRQQLSSVSDAQFNSDIQDPNGGMIYRFDVTQSFIRPINASSASRAWPYFLGHVSQFIVEYAGDFVQQDPTTGIVTGYDPNNGDGQIDFYLDKSQIPAGVKRIRWYGLPRNVHNPADPHVTPDSDVVPLRDVIKEYLSASAYVNGAPFEAKLPDFIASSGNPNVADYGTMPSNGGHGDNFTYCCAWRNKTPAMIRILFKQDDPAGRIQDGPWTEVVFNLQQ